MTKRDFFNEYYDMALQTEAQSGVPALVTMAQAAIESAYGSQAPGNNFFGIKKGTWEGPVQLLTTTEVHKTRNVKYPVILSITPRPNGTFIYKVKDYFRVYDSPLQSFEDHADFLRDNPRYSAAFKTTTPEAFADAIAKAGYATGPGYATALKAIIASLRAFIKP